MDEDLDVGVVLARDPEQPHLSEMLLTVTVHSHTLTGKVNSAGQTADSLSAMKPKENTFQMAAIPYALT